MTTHLAATMTLPAPVDRVWAMLADPGYLAAKCATALTSTFEVTDEVQGRRVTIERVLAGEVPAMARSFLGANVRLVERHEWPAQPGPERHGTLTIDVAGAPASVAGSLVLRHDGSTGSAIDIELTIKVSIPLFGGAAESMVRDELAAAVAEEEDVARAWLTA